MGTVMNMKEELASKSQAVETYLATCLEAFPMPTSLREAMNYSLLAGGKRLRPVLCLTCAELFGAKMEAIMPFAAAIECIHSYSLIHDDLPAMDDDDVRRGKPSNHKQFGEATAILAGDALLTDAFVLMTAVRSSSISADNILRAVKEVALAAGSAGMVGGQYMDMQFTGVKGITLADVATMQASKTGALLRVSCLSGAILAGANDADAAKIAAYGGGLGAAFQIVDDILDEVGDETVLGKPVGSDAAQGKSTYPALIGVEESRKYAEQVAEKAMKSLEGFKAPAAQFLRDLLEYVLKRAS